MESSAKSRNQETALRVESVSRAFGRTQALRDVSFQVGRGTVHALLGGNGSGKSTLIKILAGVEHPDQGEAEIAGMRHDLRSLTPAQARDLGLHFVHQQTSTFPELTVAENLAIGRGFEVGSAYRIRWQHLRRTAAEVLRRFHIDAHPAQPLKELRPATQTMVAIARALQDQEQASEGILLLDEPTASLPATEVRTLLDALRRYAAAGQTILYVTHRLDEVFTVANSATLLRDGQLVDTVEPRVLNHEKLVELLMGKTVEQVQRRRERSEGPTVLELRDLVGGPLKPTSFSLQAGEIVGVAGLLGSGRSSLLKSLFGVVPAGGGEVRLDGQPRQVRETHEAMAAGFAYVPQDRASDGAFGNLSVAENLSVTALDRYWHHGVLNRRAERRDANRLLDSFLVKAESIDALLSSLSGGNQQKVVLARSLRREPRVLLLDEPTQGVDVGARAEIYSLISRAVAAGAVALVVSEDFEELATVCDRVIVLRRGELVGELEGDEISSDGLNQMAYGGSPK